MHFPSALEVLAHSKALVKFWTNGHLPRRVTFWICVTHLCTLVAFLGSFIWIIALLYLFFCFVNTWPKVCVVLWFGFGVFLSCESPLFFIFNSLALWRQVSCVFALLCSQTQPPFQIISFLPENTELRKCYKEVDLLKGHTHLFIFPFHS